MRCVVGSLVLVGATACNITFNYDNTRYRCGPNGECPSGQMCVADVCVAPGGGSDAGGDTDGPIDGPGAGARCGTLQTLRDGFDTAMPWWDAWSDGGPTTQLAGSDLVITIPSGTADLWAGYATNFRYDLAESALEVEVEQIGGVDTVTEIRGPNDEKLQLLVENGVFTATVLNVANAGVRAEVPYSSSAHRWWRMREASGVTYWEFSGDGSTWSELWHESDPFSPSDVMVELSAGGEKSSGAESARFASVNVNQPAASACPVDTFVDDFAAAGFGPKLFPWTGTGASVTRTNGTIVVAANGTSDIYAGIESWHLYDLRDHAIYVEATSVGQEASFVSFFQMLAASGGQTLYEISVDGSTLNCLQRISGSNVSYQGIPYDPVAQRYWRFRGVGGQVVMETSPDATSWTTCSQDTPQFDISDVIIIAGAGEYNPTAAHSATYGGINAP